MDGYSLCDRNREMTLRALITGLAILGVPREAVATRYEIGDHRRDDACRYNRHLLQTVLELSKLYAANDNNHLMVLVPRERDAFYACDLVGSLLRLDASLPVVLASEGRYVPRRVDELRKKPTSYLVLNFSDSSLRFLINATGLSWNPRAFYIGVVDDESSAVRAMAAMWTKFIYNVAVIVSSAADREDIKGIVYETYTWRPYHPTGYCGPPTPENMVKLGKITRDMKYLPYDSNVRPAMIPRAFGGCKFKVRLNVWEPLIFPKAKPGQVQEEGLEYKLIRLSCDKLNVTFEFVEATEANDGLSVDATAGTLIPQLRHFYAGEFTTSYLQDVLLWVVPQTEEAPRWANLMKGFTLEIWIATALALALVATAMRAAGSRHWGLLTWGSALDNASPKVPDRSRPIWGPWLLLCFHLSATYKMVLVGLLITPVYRDNIETQEDIVESKLQMTFMTKGEVYFSKLDKVEGEILRRYVPCTNVPDCLDRVATKKDQAVFTNKMLVQHRTVKKYLTRYTARPSLRMLRPSLTYNVVMVMTKGHPMIAGFNRYFGIILDKGFIVHWTRQIVERWRREQYGRPFPKNNVLTLEHLQGAFVVLGCGLNLALISWIIELLYRSWTEKRCIFKGLAGAPLIRTYNGGKILKRVLYVI